ncbi:uncharacterized protein LOC134812822 isoform X2 [Bolinopsis microptera]
MVETDGTDKYDTVVTTLTCLINKMERNEVLKLLEVCDEPEKMKPLFLAIPTNSVWSDQITDSFALISAEIAEKCRQCLDWWNSNAHTSPMYWTMPTKRVPDLSIEETMKLACQAVREQAGFSVRPHPIIKPISFVDDESGTKTTICLCQILNEDKDFDVDSVHRMFFPLAGALQHIRDPQHLHTPSHVKHFHRELYNLDQTIIDKRQTARRLSEDSLICSPSPLSDDGRKRRISSSSETSDGRSPKSPCTKSPLYKRTLSMRPPPSFSGGVKPIIEMPNLIKDPRLKSS